MNHLADQDHRRKNEILDIPSIITHPGDNQLLISAAGFPAVKNLCGASEGFNAEIINNKHVHLRFAICFTTM